MTEVSFKDAITLCKSIMRNGFDAHVINTPLQHSLIEKTRIFEIDIATDAPAEELTKIYPSFEATSDALILGTLSENNYLYRFYLMDISEASHPDLVLTRLTPSILERIAKTGSIPKTLMNGMSSLSSIVTSDDSNMGFEDFASGYIQFEGLPEITLRSNYLLAIQALRYSANRGLPIEPNSWAAIIRVSKRIIEYVPIGKFMDEFRRVEAKHMWRFIKLLHDCHLLHGVLPEISALRLVMQTKNDTGIEESVLEHTIEAMKQYPEGDQFYDWIGTLAMLFHDVGKLYTGECYQGKWTFYEHHKVGAKVTQKILRRLNFLPEDIKLICTLVQNHMRFQFMMTDKGMRRFKSEPEYKRLIAMTRANIVARDENYTAFNHNNKYLERAEMPEKMVEPFLNGNEIMEVTGLAPGPHVGEIRNSLLEAQIEGKVNTRDDAILFVKGFSLLKK